jgi:hypothetical protein
VQYPFNTLVSRIRLTGGGSLFTNGETGFLGGVPFSDLIQYVYRQKVNEELIKNERFCRILKEIASNRDSGAPERQTFQKSCQSGIYRSEKISVFRIREPDKRMH